MRSGQKPGNIGRIYCVVTESDLNVVFHTMYVSATLNLFCKNKHASGLVFHPSRTLNTIRAERLAAMEPCCSDLRQYERLNTVSASCGKYKFNIVQSVFSSETDIKVVKSGSKIDQSVKQSRCSLEAARVKGHRDDFKHEETGQISLLLRDQDQDK
ncbi:Hypothetical predicted protein [Scomber scombrus]|uniref:Uncharacterized protein n=1 Tax=Scomber scombrus TaxID=13677 RepID=A0AAV1NNS3_SCOSC